VKVKVKALGRLSSSLGKEKNFELADRATIGDLLSILKEKTAVVQKEALFRFDRTEPELTVLLNGQNVQTLDGLKTLLKDGDLVLLLPSIYGG
jgi:molybdopterin converting factor small subunit